MKKRHVFELYAAAVEMATLASKGEGELNEFDHVAKDLHEEGFLDTYDDLSISSRTYLRNKHEGEILNIVAQRYKG